MAGFNLSLASFDSGYYVIDDTVDNLDGTFAVTLDVPLTADFARYYAGQAISVIGTTGDGTVELEAGEYTGITIRHQDGTTFPSAQIRARFGDLYGMYGAGSNHYFGIGIGDPTGATNFLSYNADGAGTFLLQAGDGDVTIDDGGISLAGGQGATNSLEWIASDTEKIAGLYAWKSGTQAQTNMGSHSDDGVAIASLSAQGYSPTTFVEVLAIDSNVNNFQNIMRIESDGDSRFYRSDGGDVDWKLDGFLQVGDTTVPVTLGTGDAWFKGGVNIGGVSSAAADGDLNAANDVIAARHVDGAQGVRATGVTTAGWTGDGIEMYLSGEVGRVIGYDRTGTHYLRTELRGDPTVLYEGATAILWVDAGDAYTYAFADYSSSASVTGWSSFTIKEVYYKVVGKTVFVWFYLNGTSNSTSASFRVPYATKDSANNVAQNLCRIRNNSGTPTVGFVNIPQNSNLCTIYRSPDASLAWTASGNKYAIGQFNYQRA